MNIALILLLGIAVATATLRLVLQWARTPPAARDAPWRVAALLALQPLCAALLYVTLLPPAERSTGTLVVVTRGGGAAITGDRVVALPEATGFAGTDRVPDLATAIRRFGPAALKIVGDGLEPRDLDAGHGLPVDFVLPPAPSGLVRVDFPGPVAAGAGFTVGGRVAGVAQPAVDLIDPAGRRVDTAVPDAAGDFVVAGTARAPGPAGFTLRLRGGARTVETAEVPEWTVAVPPQRLLLLAGAPGPEVKYLRRWASDAGLAVHAQLATGGDLALGDAPLAITAAALGRFDVAVLDERSWAALAPVARSAMLAAVRDGLGLLIRIDGPLSEPDRAALRPLGFAVTAGDGAVPVGLPDRSIDDAARIAREGPGSRDAPTGINRDATNPLLTRWKVAITAPAATPLVHDAAGATIASWRAEGDGRIALWPLDDSFRLVLAGRGEGYDDLWRAAFATLGRGRAQAVPRMTQAWAGQRVVICGIVGDARVVAPNGTATTLVADPTGCAAFWPRTAGWHKLWQRGRDTAWPFAVVTPNALPNVQAQANRDATLRLSTAPTRAAQATATAGRVGGSWLWAIAWLAASTGLWWLERARAGRATRSDPAMQRRPVIQESP